MAPERTLDLSNGVLRYVLDLANGVSLSEFGLFGGAEWACESHPSCDFAVHFTDGVLHGAADGLAVCGVERNMTATGAAQVTVKLRHEASGMEIDSHHIVYNDYAVWEKWITVRNGGARPVTIRRIDSFRLSLPQDKWSAMSWHSDWGAEFEPMQQLLDDSIVLETLHGRSSKGTHPWTTFLRQNGELLAVCPAWSGNWIVRCEKEAAGSISLSGGLHDREFHKALAPGETLDSVPVVLALGYGGDLHTVSVPLSRIGRTHWYPRNALSRTLPVEWNHWFGYEDKEINEQVFLANIEEAAKLGVEVCTLDAGWFGPDDAGSEWFAYRGDWDTVNRTRFPNGLRLLSDTARRKGMKFGLWCEIEAAGERSGLSTQYPDFVARRNGGHLGYVCFGNPAVREWAFRTLDRLIREYNCDWIKLDFNLDPGIGCDRADHGHGEGDGLLAHYQGYYAVLDRIRSAHPEVLLENCSSGGLRIDLGIMRHLHMSFLSDPDWPEHSLQAFWGASLCLAPDAILHWSYSQWGVSRHKRQQFDPHDPGLTAERLDFYLHIAMMRGFGLSWRLPELPDWIKERLAGHFRLYKTVIRRFLREADLYRLTDQPLREGRGDRWSAFQYQLADGRENLLFVFRLTGAEPSRTIRLQSLDPEAMYELRELSGKAANRRRTVQGAELLASGLAFDSLEEEQSALISIAVK